MRDVRGEFSAFAERGGSAKEAPGVRGIREPEVFFLPVERGDSMPLTTGGTYI